MLSLRYDRIDVIFHKAIKPYQGKVIMTVNGHADPTPVSQRMNRWWKNNMELSVTRALKVYYYFLDQGFDKEYLNVKGNSSFNPVANSQQMRDINNERRISIVLGVLR